MDHKRQHWIPQGYLKAWCNPVTRSKQEPYVWQFSKDGHHSRKKAPKKIFSESQLYTITLSDGSRDLRVEHGLSGLESEFVAVRKRKLIQRKDLTEEERLIVCAFIAAMKSRTPYFLGHWRSNWQTIEQRARDLQEAIDAGETVPEMHPADGPSLSLEDVEQCAAEERGAMLVALVQVQLPVLLKMNIMLLDTQDGVGFITSDSPCVWFDPLVNTDKLRGVGLGSRTIEVTLPISPTQTLLLMWQGRSASLPASTAMLDEINRRTRLNAHEHFVCKSNATKPEWFETP